MGFNDVSIGMEIRVGLSREQWAYELTSMIMFKKFIDFAKSSFTGTKKTQPEILVNPEFSPKNNHNNPEPAPQSPTSIPEYSIDLDTLYREISLEAGMLHIAHSISKLQPNEYNAATQQWLQTSNFQIVGATAISAKRQRDYTQAIAIFNELAQECPHYHQIHRSVMKVLAASGQIDAALRAAQLWCVAIIPEKALRLSAIHPQPTAINGTETNQRLHYLAGWAIAEQKSMYHLGSLHMIAEQELSPQEKEAYILTLQGQQKKALHPPKAAIQRGQHIAQTLPWRRLTPVIETQIWQHLRDLSWQQGKRLTHKSKAA